MKLFAPAKVNLALHVTGRRPDGYHLLDSVVVFADVGDRLDIAECPELRLSVTGPRATGVPVDTRNLVWRAAVALSPDRGAAITLEKNLPHAGGIGGGSADAGAALRGLSSLWGLPMPGADTLLSLGADVPVCAASRPARMRGIGEVLDPLPPLPPLWLVLVNPGVEVPTGPVFRALERVENPALPAPDWSDAAGLFAWLSGTRNDLEPPARAQVPQVSAVLEAVAGTDGCGLARMSGSGGTCFGLYASEGPARAAAETLRRADSGWWVTAAQVLTDAP